MMKKVGALVLASMIALCGFAACDSDNSSESSSRPSGSGQGSSSQSSPGQNNDVVIEDGNRLYITHFDGYNQCILFPSVAWDKTLHEGGKVINDWNTDTRYVSEGMGSIKVNVYQPAEDESYWYKGRIEANNGFVSSLPNINGIEGISLDICNPSGKDIEVTIEIESASQVMVSVTETCASGQWTTVSTQIPNGNYDIVSWYSITLKNIVDNEPFTVYMDNFYLTIKE